MSKKSSKNNTPFLEVRDSGEINNLANFAEYEKLICEHRNIYNNWMEERNNPDLPRP